MELATRSLFDALEANKSKGHFSSSSSSSSSSSYSPLPLSWKIKVITDMVAALRFLHNLRFLHRDIKPANVLLCIDASIGVCTAKLGDFGISIREEATRAGNSITRGGGRGAAKGTIRYMAPELFDRGVKKYSTASDVYALAVTINQVMTEQVPFDDCDEASISVVLKLDKERQLLEFSNGKECVANSSRYDIIRWL
jgi:serine/threonine protein kinase